MDILFLLIGLLAGAVAGWFFAKSKNGSGSDSLLLVEQERSKSLQKDLETTKHDLNRAQAEVLALNNKLSTSDANHKNLQERLADQKKELEALQERFAIQFKNLANDIFEEKSKKFTDQNKVNIGEILNPLKEKISEFEKKVDQTNKESVERNSALREQLINLKELNQQITKEAGNLTKALKGEAKTQGNWGEYILETILEKSGLRKGDEYVMQESLTTEDGRRLQPDVVIKLPDNKNLIIDSKVSLVAYERYISAEDDVERAINLKQHIVSLRSHIKGLSEKNYQTLYTIGSLDFVLLFIPIEPAFSTAAQHDREIFNDAFEKNIVIVSPSTLIATLRTIASIWKQEHQNKNTLEIARQATALYEKFVGLTNDLIDVGKQMRKSQETYEAAMNKLSTGKGNLVGSVEKIKLLGLKTTKNIDQNLLNRAHDDE